MLWRHKVECAYCFEDEAFVCGVARIEQEKFVDSPIKLLHWTEKGCLSAMLQQ
jgi:hypothetical protein